jgi:hypothetical protein
VVSIGNVSALLCLLIIGVSDCMRPHMLQLPGCENKETTPRIKQRVNQAFERDVYVHLEALVGGVEGLQSQRAVFT